MIDADVGTLDERPEALYRVSVRWSASVDAVGVAYDTVGVASPQIAV